MLSLSSFDMTEKELKHLIRSLLDKNQKLLAQTKKKLKTTTISWNKCTNKTKNSLFLRKISVTKKAKKMSSCPNKNPQQE
jgi:hypothetical protein